MEMQNKFVPFNRYTWDPLYVLDTLSELNPSDYHTTKEEVEWYARAIHDAPKKYHHHLTNTKKNVTFYPIIIWIFCFIVLGVLAGWDYPILSLSLHDLTKLLLPVSFVLALWAWLIYKYQIVESFFGNFIRDKYFPPIQPNVERYLSYCFMKKFYEMSQERDVRDDTGAGTCHSLTRKCPRG